jgi:hypothetical protein
MLLALNVTPSQYFVDTAGGWYFWQYRNTRRMVQGHVHALVDRGGNRLVTEVP